MLQVKPLPTSKSRGFTLIEMTVVIAVIGIVASIATQIFRSYVRTSTAASIGEQVLVVGKAGDAYIRQYKGDVVAGTPIPLPTGGQVANLLKPTTTELSALGLLTVAVSSPYVFDGNTADFVINVAVTPAGCLPAVCRINQITTLSNPWLRTLDTGKPVNEEMLNLTLTKMDGRGLISKPASPGTLVSLKAAFTVANPTPVGGILAYFSGADGGLDPAYVRVGDTRDPALVGGMTLSGTPPSSLITLQVNGAANISNSLAVGGTSSFAGPAVFNSTVSFNDDLVLRDPVAGTACIRLLRAGQIDINCNGILNAKAGTFTGPLGVVKIGDTGTAYSIDSTGSIRGALGFYSAIGSVFGANTNGIRTAGSLFTIQNSAGIDAMSVQGTGEVGIRTSLNTQALGLSAPVTLGQPCGTPSINVPATPVTTAATTVLRALAGGGLAVCSNGVWTPLSQIATLGTACSPEGSDAINSVGGSKLVCKNGVWMALSDLLSSYVLVDTLTVGHNDLINKPTCGVMGTTNGVAYPYLLPQSEGSPDAGQTASFTRLAKDVGLQWRIQLTDASGTPLLGSPRATALLLSYCFY